MKRILFSLFSLILISISFQAQAYDFYAINNGDTIYYNITSSNSPYTVAVTYKGTSSNYYINRYLGDVEIPDFVIYNGINYSVTSIEEYAFEYCSQLTSIDIGNSVTNIDFYAFRYCSGLTSINFGNSITSIATGAFWQCSSLNTITIPETITTIGSFVFGGCTSLTTCNFNAINCTSMGASSSSVFQECNNFTTLIIGNNVRNIPSYSFRECNSITSISIPNSVISIGVYAFFDCDALNSITIGNSVSSIGNYSFYNFGRSLTSITCLSRIPPTITSLSFNTYYGPTTVYVPCGSLPFYQSAPYWLRFTSFQTINLPYITNLTASICQGETYTFNGLNLDTSGVFTQNLQTLNGCDSVVNLVLIVNQPDTTNIEASICQGETYTLNGFNSNTEGVYTQNLQTINGCDSVVNLNLIINQIPITNIEDTICQGGTYILNGFNADTSGLYTQNLQTIYGCDSIVNLNLIVKPISITNIESAICQGENYTLNGFNVSGDGIYTQNLQAINGCDSIVTLNLIVHPLPLVPENLEIRLINNYLEVTWLSNGEIYEIYRNEELLATVNQPIYLDTNVVNSQSYCYKIKALSLGCESELSDEICRTFIGIKDIMNDDLLITLYPNPANEMAKLELNGLNSNADVIIYDINGRKISQYKLSTGQRELEIDIKEYSKGLYYLTLITNNGIITKKLIVL